MNKTLHDSNGDPILIDVSKLEVERYVYSVVKSTEQQARITDNNQSTIYVNGTPLFIIKNNGAK